MEAPAHRPAKPRLEGSPGRRYQGEEVGYVDALVGMGADESGRPRDELVLAGEDPCRLALHHVLRRQGHADSGRDAAVPPAFGALERGVENGRGAEADGLAVEHYARKARRGELAEDVLVVDAENGKRVRDRQPEAAGKLRGAQARRVVAGEKADRPLEAVQERRELALLGLAL